MQKKRVHRIIIILFGYIFISFLYHLYQPEIVCCFLLVLAVIQCFSNESLLACTKCMQRLCIFKIYRHYLHLTVIRHQNMLIF